MRSFSGLALRRVRARRARALLTAAGIVLGRRDDPGRPAAGGDHQPHFLRPLRLRLRQDRSGRIRRRRGLAPGEDARPGRPGAGRRRCGRRRPQRVHPRRGWARLPGRRQAAQRRGPGSRCRGPHRLADGGWARAQAGPGDRDSGELGEGERREGRRARSASQRPTGPRASTSWACSSSPPASTSAARDSRRCRCGRRATSWTSAASSTRSTSSSPEATRRSRRSRSACASGSPRRRRGGHPAGEGRRGGVPAPGLQRDPLLLRRHGPLRRGLPDLQRVQHERLPAHARDRDAAHARGVARQDRRLGPDRGGGAWRARRGGRARPRGRPGAAPDRADARARTFPSATWCSRRWRRSPRSPPG